MPRIENVELERLELTSSDTPMVLHPITIEADLEVKGEAFESQVMFGLQADDGAISCALGEAPVSSDENGTSTLTISREFVIEESCSAMVGRSDVELFVAFDPWRTTSMDREGSELSMSDADSLIEFVESALVDTEDCAQCDSKTELLESPGLDAQLRSVELGSTVTTLLLPASPDQTEMPPESRPNFVINAKARVTGLRKGETPSDATFMRYRLRPLADAPAAAGLEDEDLQWVTLDDHDGTTASGDETIKIKGQQLASSSTSVYIDDAIADHMNRGAWRQIDEFELETCVGTEYDQAVYPGEASPRANDCATLGVVVLRESTRPEGQRAVSLDDLDDMLALGAKSRDANVATWEPEELVTPELRIPGLLYGHYDILPKFTFGVKAEAYNELSSSDTAGETYGGISFPEASVWAGAGASFEAEMFGTADDGHRNYSSIFDSDIAAIVYVTGGGKFEYGVSVLGTDVFANSWSSDEDGFEITLADVLSSDAETIYTEEIPVPGWGFKFDAYAFEFEIGVMLQPRIGIDADATKVTATLGGGVAGLEAEIVPLYGIDVTVGAETSFVSLEGALELLTATLPVNVGAFYDYYNGTLTLEEGVQLGLNTLAGSFSGEICIPATDICADSTIFEWDGFGHSITLGESEQTIIDNLPILADPGELTGGEITTDIFCERWDGDQVQIRGAGGGDNYFYESGTAGHLHDGYDDERGVFQGWDEGPTTFTVRCTDSKVSLQTSGGEWLFADGTQAAVFDQFSVFTSSNALTDYAKFTIVPQNEEGAIAFATHEGKYLTSGFTFAVEFDDNGDAAGFGDAVRPLQQSEYVGDMEQWEVVPQ